MNFGIIGCQGHYRYVLEELNSSTPVCIAEGVEGEDLSRLVLALDKKGIPYVQCDASELRRRCDVVAVNTRFDQNAAHTKALLQEGKAVFSEKPLAIDRGELEALRRTHESFPAPLAAMFGLRYTPWFCTLRREAETLGDLRLISAQKSYRLGTRPAFYGRQDQFGGILPWVAIHALDWIAALIPSPVVTLSAHTDRTCNRNMGDLETAAVCQLRMENGALACITADFLRPDEAPCHDDDRIRVVASHGILEYQKGSLSRIDANGERTVPLQNGQSVFGLFLRRLAGEEVGVTAEESFALTDLALRARDDALSH